MLKHFDKMKISFHGRILGFDNLNMFVIQIIEDTPFAYLKSMEDPEISFLITAPFQWHKDYSLHLDDLPKKKLHLEKPEDVLVICIVTLNESLESSTINLLGPLIINVNEAIGMQYVVHEKGLYRTNSPLIHPDSSEEEVR